MAKQMGQNGLAGKLQGRLDAAVAAHAKDEIKLPGGGELPAGIENGIAKLVDCRFSQYKEGENKGEYFFLAAGVVVEPTVFQNIPIEGQRTQIMEPIYDTPTRSRKTIDDHVGWIMNEMRKLGVPTEGLTGGNLEAAAAALKEAAPHFLFRTWKGEPTPEYPNPRTNQTWVKAVDYAGSPSDEVVDNSGPSKYAPSDEAKPAAAAKAAPKTAAKTATKPKAAPKAPEPEPEPEYDLAALGEAADGDPEGDEAKILHGLAEAAGIDSTQIATWGEVATMLAEAAGGDGGDEGAETAAEGDASVPQVNEIYYYKAPKAAKAAEMEVKAVFEDKGICTLQDLATKALHRGVAFSALQDGP